MDDKKLHKLIGFLVFLIAFFTYFSTVQPSVSFWDCGEFIASAFHLQVPHPPGTPLFLLVGRLFSMIPFVDNIGLRVNTISVLTSSFTILFLYLVAVKVILNWKGGKHDNLFDAILTYSAAAIGALSLAFSDTFWFNAVEAEVYASATFFIAFVTWLLMVWNEKADQPDNEKYLIMIAYLIGLSTGVHLMSLLGLVTIVMVIYYRKYLSDEEVYLKTSYIFLGHIALVTVIAAALWSSTPNHPLSPQENKAFDSRFLMIVGFASLIYMGAFYKKIFQKNSIYIPVIIGGLILMGVYPGVIKYTTILIATLSDADFTMNVVVLLAILGVFGYLIHWTNKNNKATFNLIVKAFLFVLLGFTTYTMIIIRANQEPPINLNNPDTVPGLVSYLNREQYGDQPMFKRRFSQEPHQQRIYKDYGSDLDFLIRYQMNHMFNRYLMWNYIGRVSTVQDAGVKFNQLFAIPFILGLFGLWYHFKKDWKIASAFLVLFIFLGYLTAYYQNQQEPQPRERDYFYVGAFFVYSLWIALGMRGIFEIIQEYIKDFKTAKIATIVAIAIGFVFVPVNMLQANYFTHDRSRNFVPWDYSYNLLQSAAPNAILFTNGDNDTFPVWYLQDVEGVRRDVRIVNLSLLNTPWYIKQLKHTTPYGTDKVALSLSDAEIDRIGPAQWKPKTISIPVPKDVYAKFGVTDTSIINKGKITWKMENTVQFGNIKAVRVQDLVVLDIVKSNKWKRPIYFAITTGTKGNIGLDDYLVMEGMSYKLTPVRQKDFFRAVNEKIMRQHLLEEPEGFYREFHPGFKFRGLRDSTIFFNDNHRRLALNYRNPFLRLAFYYLNTKREKDAVAVLDTMEYKIPRKLFPMDYRILNDVANLYYSAGAKDKYEPLAREIEKTLLEQIKKNPLGNLQSQYNPYFMLGEIYSRLNEMDKFDKALETLENALPNDPRAKDLVKQYKAIFNRKLENNNKEKKK